jgi:hypothetical protein
MIVGLTGYAQHGKDSMGNLFQEHLGYRKMAFADGLRKCVYTLNPVVPYETPGQVPWARYRDLLDTEGYERAKQRPEVRRLLQVFGTEVARDILGEDTWVNALNVAWANDGRPDAVITDVRFPNECEFVQSHGGIVIRVTRLNEDGTQFDNGVPTSHPSESHIADLPIDVDVIGRNLADLKEAFSLLVLDRKLQ